MKRINVNTVQLVRESARTYALESTVISCPLDAYNVAESVFQLSQQPAERMGILCLDAKYKVTGAHIIFSGALSATIASPREIFQAALLNNAASVVLFHNHPSGDPTPSWEDITITENIIKCGEMIGITVVDHIVIGHKRYISVKEHAKL